MKIAGAEVFQYALPLARPIPLRGRPLASRAGLLLRLHAASGHSAWGEASPLPGFSRETLTACRKKLGEVMSAVLSHGGELDAAGLGRLEAFRGPAVHSAAYFAVESAWHLLEAAAAGRTPWGDKAPARDASLRLNALLAGDDDAILEKAGRVPALGYRAVKLKVGRERMTDDIQLVRAVRECVGPDVAMRLDANQAWSLEDAILFGKAAAGTNIAYIEEPCAAPGDLPAFHRATGIPYAIDESIYTIHDMVQGRSANRLHDRVIAGVVNGAAALVWKPTLIHTPNLGKLLFRDVSQGQSNRIVISAAFESGVGIAALANYAAMFAAPETPAGLDTYDWMEPDILRERLPMTGGTADLHAINAAAQSVDLDRLERVWPL